MSSNKVIECQMGLPVQHEDDLARLVKAQDRIVSAEWHIDPPARITEQGFNKAGTHITFIPNKHNHLLTFNGRTARGDRMVIDYAVLA